MSLINCPECNIEVSDTASSCINCGYSIKPANKSNTFQTISLVSVLICLFNPVFLINFTLHIIIIVTSLVSLIKNERWRWLSVFILFYGAIMLSLSIIAANSQ